MSTISRDFVLRDGNIVQALWAFLKANAKAMAAQDRPLMVSIREYKAKRTLEQNAKLHALLTDIANNAWVNGRQYDAETWKEYYRRKLIGIEEFELPDGTRSERGISTTTLDVGDFAKLITQIECHAVSDLGVELPL